MSLDGKYQAERILGNLVGKAPSRWRKAPMSEPNASTEDGKNPNPPGYLTAVKDRIVVHLLRKRFARIRFSIVSNNCWGAHIYQRLQIPFSTPFVGLFLSPTAYLQLLENFRKMMSSKLTFKQSSDEEWINKTREAHSHRWPIGNLDNKVEIQFMHYKSEAEANDKWERRTARIAKADSELFFKFCDRDGCSDVQMEAFDRLAFKNKVFFTARKTALACAVTIPGFSQCVPDGRLLSEISSQYFNTTGWLTGGSALPKWWSRWISYI